MEGGGPNETYSRGVARKGRDPRSGKAGASGGVRLETRVILWEGRPAVSMTATGPRGGVVVWSAMLRGRQASFPSELIAAVQSLGARLRRRR
jgi:hypothetical protein